MKLVNVETKDQLKMLVDAWAMTWEGLDSRDFETALDYCCKEGKEGTGYLIKGVTMNQLCGLTGNNAYPTDLNIFAIKDFKGLAIQYGARWMYDIYTNNADREGFMPFALDEN